MNILYLGSSNESSNSALRAKALERIGHSVTVIDPYKILQNISFNKIFRVFHYNTGYIFFQKKVLKWLNSIFNHLTVPDIFWIDSGELFGYDAINLLRKKGAPIILYNTDDPTGKRDGNRFKSLLNTVNLYDSIVVVRPETKTELLQLGARKAVVLYRGYDEVAHAVINTRQEVPEKFRSDIAFIGTWIRNEQRDVFLLKLIENGLSVSIWGNRWQKSKYWKQLEPNYRGTALGGRDYSAAIRGAKVCLGMMSKGNRDLHTRRSFEIPSVGGLLCAERTTEHTQLFEEGVEAVFWSDAEECIKLCEELLSNEPLREKIRLAGMERIRSIGVGNEDICRKILSEI